MFSIRSLCVLALPLLATALTPSRIHRRVTVDCCPDNINVRLMIVSTDDCSTARFFQALSPAGITLIAQLLDDLNLGVIPSFGTIGIDCTALSLESALDGTCNLDDIFACLVDLVGVAHHLFVLVLTKSV